jgi:gamma-glutamylcyclotransferase (GGCT)/AIG2-like uncharacterized protein YtfP
MTQYLFAYGTLRPGQAPAEIAPVADKLLPVSEGTIRGSLYDLGHYPGAVLEPSTAHEIHGTVFLLPEAPAVLATLDAYEEYNPNDPAGSQFLRELNKVALPSGATLDCWIYVYNAPVDPSRIVPSGIYPTNRPHS